MPLPQYSKYKQSGQPEIWSKLDAPFPLPFSRLGVVGSGCIRLDGADWGFVGLVDFD